MKKMKAILWIQRKTNEENGSENLDSQEDVRSSEENQSDNLDSKEDVRSSEENESPRTPFNPIGLSADSIGLPETSAQTPSDSR